jgi:hypothetical protein
MKLAHFVSSKRLVGGITVALILGAALATPSSASPITLGQKTLAQLFVGVGDTPVSNAGNIMITTMTAPLVGTILNADVYSACYKNTEGKYVYLYEIDNNGGPNYHPVELFTIFPFFGSNVLTTNEMGYITGSSVPTGYLAAAQNPESVGNVNANNTLSFYYGLRYGYDIAVGENSTVMYVISPWGPTTITGNIIDGTVATGPVVGPVPEPATMAILAIGGGLVLLRSKRRK